MVFRGDAARLCTAAAWARQQSAPETKHVACCVAERAPMVEKVEKIWLDGNFVPWDEAKVHVLTHTLHYGLGVFEGIRCYRRADGRSAVFRLREHVDRLFESAHIS